MVHVITVLAGSAIVQVDRKLKLSGQYYFIGSFYNRKIVHKSQRKR